MNGISIRRAKWSTSARQDRSQLLAIFWAGAGSLVAYELYLAQSESIWLNLACACITFAALLPSYLWCAGKALGMPIFPMFALTFVWTYGLPLVSEHPHVLAFSLSDRLFAAATTVGFLLLGAFVWFRFVNEEPAPPKYYRALGNVKGSQFFFWTLSASVLFNIANAGGWLAALQLSGGMFALLRNTIVALTALSAFTLSYRMGARELTSSQSKRLVLLLAAFMFSSAISFLLIGAATVFLSGVSAFIIGRRRVPVLIILPVTVLLMFLHSGKGDMRLQYWGDSNAAPYFQVWDYPAIYAEWIGKSFQQQQRQATPSTVTSGGEHQSFTERASVIHMLMLSQTQSPREVPYLKGNTYKILPELLIPRILKPNKIRSHEGTHRLNIHYGRQTREDTYRTTIAWGLLAESYANFGLLGCAGLAVVLGSLYGQISRLSINAPILSFRALIAVYAITYAFQSEWTAGVYVAAVGQHGIVLLGIAIVLMENQPIRKLDDYPIQPGPQRLQLEGELQ